ncbi:hypothetical protein LUPAC06_01664 [Micromonospora saelicesensis]|uniref:hypothetical protein n=1 Tax=Micromonospora saelicesensis TaxID=285676 RepID=UPI000DBF5720|nr:hypothetical protein [Micromonospora saelicesensis]RAO59522.1 hypothetical protein LUPAC06_01664 [Micromonospora saelicesensis]
MSISWSTIGHTVRLTVTGARRWLALPDRRPVTVAAVVLIALLVGAFGAAAGSWLSTRAVADLPSEATLADLSRRATGVDEAPVVSRETSPRTAARFAADTTLATGWDSAQARQRYAAAGWSVSPLTVTDDQASVLYPGDKAVSYLPSRYARFTAESGGLVIEVSGGFVGADGVVRLAGWAADSPVVPALTIAGAALGLITGWLLAVTTMRRVRPTHPAHRATVSALTVTALLVLAAPAIALYGNLVRTLRPHVDTSGPAATVHSALTPDPYWSAAPAWLLPGLTAAGGLIAVITLVLAASTRLSRVGTVDSPAGVGDWEAAASTVEASIEAARVDRDAAQRLLFLSAYPDWTPGSLDRMRERLINAGVPADFLTTSNQSRPDRP